MDKLRQKALEAGFTHAGNLDPKTIELREDVRAMCAENLCGQYGKNWGCPPACGSLEELKQMLDTCSHGLLVQTVAQLKDEFDVQTMLEAERGHKQRFLDFFQELKKDEPQAIALGAGSCTRCKACTYPHAPCRFPEEKQISMEACGMLVNQVLKDNGMAYYYGKHTISYTSCYLFRRAR